MRHSDSARPLSGEIMMPDRARGSQRQSDAGRDAGRDVVDVGFETLAPGEKPEARAPRTALPSGETVSGLDMLKPGAAHRRVKRGPAGPLFWAVGALFIAGAFWVSGGHSLVQAMDFGQRETPSQALRLVEVTSRVERQGSQALLIVDGAAFNGGSKIVAIPSISINVTSENGSTTRYFLGTNEQHLGPGARFPFSSRLVAPSEGVKSVSVTFRSS